MYSLLPVGVFCCCVLLSLNGEVTGNSNDVPVATDIVWSSINFKTILEWKPKPANYTYTVDVYGKKSNTLKSKYCILTTKTECDLTSVMTNVNDTYTARVNSVPNQQDEDPEEARYALSPKITPYRDTQIGQPKFSIEINEQKDWITLLIEDPVSGLRKSNGSFMSIREIFRDDFKYRVFYRRASSTGKKEADTTSNKYKLKIDRGESYCFTVQVIIPSRDVLNQFGQESEMQCSPMDTHFLNEYGIGAKLLVCAAVVIVIVVVIITAVVCKKKNDGKKASNSEGLALNKV
ncbi:coagulation factor IIIa [Polypterus senegalus]|uniref:coagulation factor IIIa n=1 Tax=Polypterus senegalus TaxID=55291 RepID=UPI001964A548|nr:coagulation factor IIIa [Polypterus senegalus]